MTAGIDWGDHPDWPDRLEAARQPPTAEQAAWDRHWVRHWSAAVRNGTDPTRAVRTAHERTKGPLWATARRRGDDMTEDELREYAEALLLEHARDIEFLSVFEMAEEHAPGGEITDDEAREVDDKLAKASITITWPDGVWS